MKSKDLIFNSCLISFYFFAAAAVDMFLDML